MIIEKSKFSTGESAYRYIGNEALTITRKARKKFTIQNPFTKVFTY